MPKRAKDFGNKPLPKVKFIVKPDLLPEGIWGVLFGDQETYKTWLALDLAWKVSQGKPWLAWDTVKTTTLFVNTELPETLFQSRWHHMAKTRGGYPDDLYVETHLTLKIDEEMGISYLNQWVSETGAKLVIIDNLYRAFAGKLSAEADATKFLDNLTFLRAQYNCTILFIAHNRKKGVDQRTGQVIHAGLDDLFGSSFFKNNVNLAIEVRKIVLPNQTRVTLHPEKTSFAEKEVPLTQWIVTPTVEFRRP
jgi:RecA-family ATPase